MLHGRGRYPPLAVELEGRLDDAAARFLRPLRPLPELIRPALHTDPGISLMIYSLNILSTKESSVSVYHDILSALTLRPVRRMSLP
jgi:hypothetical protein